MVEMHKCKLMVCGVGEAIIHYYMVRDVLTSELGIQLHALLPLYCILEIPTVHQLTCLMVIQRISIYSVKIQPAFLIVMKVNTRIGYALRVSQILYNTQCLTHHGELGKATPDK